MTRFNEVTVGSQLWVILAGAPVFAEKINHMAVRKLSGRCGKSYVPGNPPVYQSEAEAANGLVEMLRLGREAREMNEERRKAKELEPAVNAAVGRLLASLQAQHAEADAAAGDNGDFCHNCHKPWPCGCDDPAWGCGICAGDQYDCRCSERSYVQEFDEQLEELRALDATYAQASGRWGW